MCYSARSRSLSQDTLVYLVGLQDARELSAGLMRYCTPSGYAKLLESCALQGRCVALLTGCCDFVAAQQLCRQQQHIVHVRMLDGRCWSHR